MRRTSSTVSLGQRGRIGALGAVMLVLATLVPTAEASSHTCPTVTTGAGTHVFYGDPPYITGRSGAYLEAPAGTAVEVNGTARAVGGGDPTVTPAAPMYRLQGDPSIPTGPWGTTLGDGAHVFPDSVVQSPAFLACTEALFGGLIPPAPDRPANATATAGPGSISLRWEPPPGSPDVLSYRVSRSGTDTSGGGLDFTVDLAPRERSYTLRFLREEPYRVSLRAVDAHGAGYPVEVEVTPLAATTPTTTTTTAPTTTTTAPTTTTTAPTTTTTTTPPPRPTTTTTAPSGGGGGAAPTTTTTVASTAQTAAVCPAPGQTDRFTDDDGGVHETNVDCAARYAIVRGVSPTQFAPGGNLTRAQAATILVRYVEWSRNAPLAANGTVDFTDIAGDVHAANIEKAADNDIVQGFAGHTFGPDQLITRAQLASMAVRATERVLGSGLAADGSNAFGDDDGSVHEANIEKAVDSRILEGTGPRAFSPGANVTRGQTATIVMRAVANALYPAGAIAP